MPGKVVLQYWDANCFLHYVNRAPEHLQVLEELIRRATLADQHPGRDNNPIRICTSVLSIAEVQWGLDDQQRRSLSGEVLGRIDSLWDMVVLVEVTEFIARRACHLARDAVAADRSLQGSDAVHLASAEYAKATEIFTYERRLWPLSHLVGIPIKEPAVAQLPLNLATATGTTNESE